MAKRPKNILVLQAQGGLNTVKTFAKDISIMYLHSAGALASPSEFCGSCITLLQINLCTIQYEKCLRAKSSKQCCVCFSYHPVSVLKINRKNHVKPKISAYIIVHVVSPHLNPRFQGQGVDTC